MSARLYPSAITVDVEDGISIGMKDHFGISIPPTDRVLKNMDIILDLMQKYDTHSTFFFLGEIVEKYPDLIKKVCSQNHELGIHGYFHDKLYNVSEKKFREDIVKVKDLIENLTGEQVNGFRAPEFSINGTNSTLLEVLADLGFKYDSSIVPVKNKRYGWNGFPKDIIRLDLLSGNSIYEIPLPVVKIFGHQTLACGGGYLRYFPLSYTNWAFRTISEERPVVVYLHPYELDVEKYPDYFHSEIRKSPLKKALPLLAYRFGKGTVARKLEYLLTKNRFEPLSDIIDKMIDDNSINNLQIRELL